MKMGTFDQYRLSAESDAKRKVAKTPRHTITAPKVMVILTQVRAYLLCLKTFEFVSFYTQKIKFSTKTLKWRNYHSFVQLNDN